MMISQGDLIRISGFQSAFLVISKNAYIRSSGVFHVCPVFPSAESDPMHIPICGTGGIISGIAICEQIRLMDPSRGFRQADRISYYDMINISDAIQGMFEYD